MQSSIPWSSSVSVFATERMTIIHSLKCTVPFSFVVPLLSLAFTIAIYCHSLSLVVSLVVTLCTTRCHSLSLVVPLVVTRCHSLSLVVTRCATRCHSLSLVAPLVCLFINDPLFIAVCLKVFRDFVRKAMILIRFGDFKKIKWKKCEYILSYSWNNGEFSHK